MRRKRRQFLQEEAPERAPIKRNRPKTYSRFPLAIHVKRAIDFLKEKRKAYTYEEIVKLAPIKLKQNRKVEELEKLLRQKSDKLIFDPQTGRFSYRPVHDIKNMKEVFHLLNNKEHLYSGVDTGDLMDSYEGVEEDLDRFKKEHKDKKKKEVIVIRNNKTRTDILYYNRERYRREPIHPKLKEQWEKTKEKEGFPTTSDSIDYYIRNIMKQKNLKSVDTVEWESEKINKKRKREVEGQIEDERKKKRRKRSNARITNIHMLSQEEQEKYFNHRK